MSKSLVRSNQIILACHSLGILDDETEVVTIVVKYKDTALMHEWRADNRPSEEMIAAVRSFAMADPNRIECIAVHTGIGDEDAENTEGN